MLEDQGGLFEGYEQYLRLTQLSQELEDVNIVTTKETHEKTTAVMQQEVELTVEVVNEKNQEFSHCTINSSYVPPK